MPPLYLLLGASALRSLANTPQASPRFEDASAMIAADIAGFSDGSHGVAWLDVEGDGDLDLVQTNGIGFPVYLWRNDLRPGQPTVFTQDRAFPEMRTGTSGVLAADFDGDEATDLLVLGEGALWVPPSPSYLLRNTEDGTFVDVTAASGLAAVLSPVSVAATAADIDGDGDLEVLVTSPGHYPDHTHADALLFLEDGRWVDRAASWGVDEANANCVASFVHLDEDAFIDLLVGSCNQVQTSSIRVYRNDGRSFARVDVDEHVWAQGYWMGFALGDFDANGQTDLFATNLGADVAMAPALYLQSDGFTQTAPPFGLHAWGAAAFDFDLDGALDLFQVGEPQTYRPASEQPGSPGELAFGNGDGTFVSGDVGVDLSGRLTSGLAGADYDGDGYVDLAVGVTSDVLGLAAKQPVLLHNVGGDGDFVAVRLYDPDHPNHGAIGARITAELPDGRRMTRQVLAGTSFASTESLWPVFGLAGRGEARLSVRWPDGAREDFGRVASGSTLHAVRGEGVGETAGDSASADPEARHGCATASSRRGAPPPGLRTGWGSLAAWALLVRRRRPPPGAGT
jgi:hypothetical protein